MHTYAQVICELMCKNIYKRSNMKYAKQLTK